MMCDATVPRSSQFLSARYPHNFNLNPLRLQPATSTRTMVRPPTLLLICTAILVAASAIYASSSNAATARKVEPEMAKCSHKALVIMSSEGSIILKNDKNQTTGFYLDELMIPLTALMDAGWEPTFANPKGNRYVLQTSYQVQVC